jgi:Holliday junction resolvase RusA-like endonuclease
MELLKLEIPLTSCSLNQWYAGNHWRKRQEKAKLWHETIYNLCLEHKIEPIKDYPVIVETQTYFKDNRKRDSSNYITANKLIEDGLVKCGILKDDGPDYILANFVYAPIRKAKENKTILIIREGEF